MNHISKTLANIGFILALIGSLILIIIGIAGLLGLAFLIFAPVFALGSVIYGIVMIIVGIICAGASRYVTNVGTAILLIILAIIASLLGASFAAWLIAIGAIIGLIARL